MTKQEQRQHDQVEGLKEMQAAQKAALTGDKKAIPMIAANRDKTKKIRAHEGHLIHVETLVKNADAAGKNILEDRKTLKLHARMFDQMLKGGAFHAFDDARVIHDPRPDAPESYDFKPDMITDSPLSKLPKSDAAQASALAAREQKIKQQEAALDEKIAKLEALQAASADADTSSKIPPLPDELADAPESTEKVTKGKTKQS